MIFFKKLKKSECLSILWILFLSLSLWPGCIPPKSIFLGHPDYRDSKRFPAQSITAPEESFRFYESGEDWSQRIRVNDWTSDLPVFQTAGEIAAGHSTRAMLIIRNDTILYEYYAEGSEEDDVFPSYSMAKSFTSALVGIAIQEGYIKDVDELVKSYLPELNFHPNFDKLTIRHLLNHTSGIKYDLSVDAHIYYGRDMRKGISRIDFETEPGKKQSYLNINSQLLGMVLESATGVSPASYLEEKIWQPLGMESNAFWSDDKRNNIVKTYCCLNASARDYAKFGRLFMNKGNWDGTQIIDRDWIHQSIRMDTTQGSSYGYNFSWHIGLKEYGDFMANGLYKQHIYINPRKNLIIVLLNRKENKLKAERVNWWYVFRQVADQM